MRTYAVSYTALVTDYLNGTIRETDGMTTQYVTTSDVKARVGALEVLRQHAAICNLYNIQLVHVWRYTRQGWVVID